MNKSKILLGLFLFIVVGFVNFSSADFIDDISSVGSSIVNIILYIWSFITALVSGVVTMFTNMYELIVQLFNSGLF